MLLTAELIELRDLGVSEITFCDNDIQSVKFFSSAMRAIPVDRRSVDMLTMDNQGKSRKVVELEKALGMCENAEEATALKKQLQAAQLEALTYFASDV